MPRKKINRPARMAGDAIKSADDVLRVADERRNVLTGGLRSNLGETRPDGTPADYDGAIDIHTGAIRQRRDVLWTKDHDHRDTEAELEGLRIDLGEAVETTGQNLILTRQAFEGMFGEKTAIKIGFVRQMPDNASDMLDHGAHLIRRLRNPSAELAPLFQEVTSSPGGFAQGLEPSVTALGGAYEGYQRGQKRFETAIVERSEALVGLRKVFGPSAQGLESLFKLADLDELAKRVRPSRRRPGLTADRADAERASEGSDGSTEGADGSTEGADGSTGSDGGTVFDGASGSDGESGGSEGPPAGSVDTDGSDEPSDGSEGPAAGSADGGGDP